MIADAEIQHPFVRSHLAQEAQALDDPIVLIHELRFGQRVDVDAHG